eukprot:3661866-Pyramimonas_sp.AAC.1
MSEKAGFSSTYFLSKSVCTKQHIPMNCNTGSSDWRMAERTSGARPLAFAPHGWQLGAAKSIATPMNSS